MFGKSVPKVKWVWYLTAISLIGTIECAYGNFEEHLHVRLWQLRDSSKYCLLFRVMIIPWSFVMLARCFDVTVLIPESWKCLKRPMTNVENISAMHNQYWTLQNVLHWYISVLNTTECASLIHISIEHYRMCFTDTYQYWTLQNVLHWYISVLNTTEWATMIHISTEHYRMCFTDTYQYWTLQNVLHWYISVLNTTECASLIHISIKHYRMCFTDTYRLTHGLTIL